MRRARVLPAIVLVALTMLIACTKGDECDKCTTDADCKEGFFCTEFDDQSHRCGSGVGATTCRVR
jgi:major membrane immunogen (membrane-anchored lipoprotein)